jgi:bifunctional non-homologous end joining protein LigD
MSDLPAPMLATAAAQLPPDDDAWAYEMKWDGYRAIVEVADGALRIVSRRGNDLTARYPELSGLTDAVDVDVVLDGELVVLDENGRPSFQELQQHTAPAAYFCFDVLRLDGRDVTALPWHERRALLDGLALSSDRWQTPPATVADGTRTSETARALGLEGVVAKRVDSPYTPGKRSSAWRKVRFTLRQELVVGGWLPGEGRLSGTVGSLLVGHYDGGALVYAGRVGSGLDDRAREALARLLARRDTPPFAPPVPRLPDAVWVEPDVVAEVRFSEWTTDGVLRQPVFLGLRDDKPPQDVVRES